MARAAGSTTDASLTVLRLIKSVHTGVWALFVSAILGIPVAAFRDRFDWVLVLAGIVAVEVAILALNGMRCPLTPIAARYTADRRDNFDIYLPVLIARYNKEIFGALYAMGLLFALQRWLVR